MIINNILLYFYNFSNPNNIIFKDNYIYYDNNIYILKKINNINIDNISNSRIHRIIKNKFNMFISTYNNEYYVLLKIVLKEKNREVLFDDIIYLIKTPVYKRIEKNNYYIIWKRKIEFLEKYIHDYYNNYEYDFNYFNGLSYNSINIMKNINYLNITYGVSFKRFYKINTIYDLYDPFNIEVGPIIDSIVEFIKYQFFYKNNKINIDKIFYLNINREDYYYLVARLLFPTYYYDLFKDNNIVNNYYIITNNIDNYIKYIKEIIIVIKKRHNQMSLLDNIINLL